AFFYLVVIGTALTFSLYLKGAQMIGGPKASILSCAEPLSSALRAAGFWPRQGCPGAPRAGLQSTGCGTARR
ncbi:DMT family transporter, partial [Enterobacter hormaechei]|nr:DMT family transporter [Enterobacter hormaechei]